VSVIPAKAGIQGAETGAVALDPRFRDACEVLAGEGGTRGEAVGGWRLVYAR
jgi:hypothetical protein